jgi:hypothetical protein
MPLQYLFWGLYIFALLVCGFLYYEPTQPVWARRFGGCLDSHWDSGLQSVRRGYQVNHARRLATRPVRKDRSAAHSG